MDKYRDKILIFLKGLLMGACDVIPGVSGGTIAVITGIYERLITAIKNIIPNLGIFFKGKWKNFRKNIDGTFLVILILGIGISIFSFANLITSAMEKYPILIWSFFVGLILISAVFLGKQVKWDCKTILSLFIFAVIAYFITSPENAPISDISSWRYTFICGMIAICAMILPGISGSFMLVLLGKYEEILGAVKDLNITTLLLFALGAIIGIILFSNILSRLFKNYKMLTLASLTGFMIGSLNKIWPWKETIDSVLGTEKNILPWNYQGNNMLIRAILCMILGIAIVVLIEYLGDRLQRKSK